MNVNLADFDTGDVVYHALTDEELVIAFVRDGRIHPCGWPPVSVAVFNCVLREKATPEEKAELLQKMSESTGQLKEYADRMLAGDLPPAEAPRHE